MGINDADTGRPKFFVCENLRPEWQSLAPPGTDLEFLEPAYHRRPQDLPVYLNRRLAEEPRRPRVVLVLGLCSRAVLGVGSERHTLVLPRVHDCVGLFLGSQERYRRLLEENPRRFFLTSGWLETAEDPWSKFRDWQDRFGQETARWLQQQFYVHFNRLSLLDTGVLSSWHWERARRVSEFTGWPLEVVEGDLRLFSRLLGPPREPDLLVVSPGQTITGDEFQEQGEKRRI